MNPKRSTTKTASARIGVIFLILGALSLAVSIIQEVQILAFVGLGLTFWGALFVIIAPTRYVDGSLLDAATLPNYQTVDRIIKSFKQTPSAYHMPSYPIDARLPEHLKGLKDMVVFITNDNEKATPNIQELTEGKFIINNPSGVAISPPGISLLTAIENKTNTDFTKMSLEELCETLPNLLLQNFGVANDMELTIIDQNSIKLDLIDSIYKDLYIRQDRPKSIAFLGCPIVSAIACAVAKTTGKPTTIQEPRTSPNGLRLETVIKIKQD